MATSQDADRFLIAFGDTFERPTADVLLHNAIVNRTLHNESFT